VFDIGKFYRQPWGLQGRLKDQVRGGGADIADRFSAM
jgi:hypothetical protein